MPSRTPGATWCSGGVIQQWDITLAVCSDRRKPITIDSTRFARVMRELGMQQIIALSPQPNRRVDRMLETFQERLVTEVPGRYQPH